MRSSSTGLASAHDGIKSGAPEAINLPEPILEAGLSALEPYEVGMDFGPMSRASLVRDVYLAMCRAAKL